MSNELLFRTLFSILWIIFIVSMTLAWYSSRRPKSEPSNDQKARHARRLYIVARASLAPFWWAAIVLYIVFSSWVAFLSIPMPDWFRLIMVGVAALSCAFTLWSFRTLGKNWIHLLNPSEFQHRRMATLVTSGPYHYVRHPMYLGWFIFLIAQALVAANWLILLPSLATTILFYTQIGKEEAMLIDRFGDEYRDYMKRTPRFIPGLGQ